MSCQWCKIFREIVSQMWLVLTSSTIIRLHLLLLCVGYIHVEDDCVFCCCSGTSYTERTTAADEGRWDCGWAKSTWNRTAGKSNKL